MRLVAKGLLLMFGLVAAAGMFELGIAPNFLAALFVFLLIQFVAIFVHELGHAIAAKTQGAAIEALSVLWWEYDFVSRKLGAARQLGDGDVGGFVVYSFGEREPTRRDDAIVSAAGPAANLLLALLALVAAWSLAVVQDRTSGKPVAVVEAGTNLRPDLPLANLPSDIEMRDSLARYDGQRRREAIVDWLQGVASVLALLSLGMGLSNLIPFRGSDGDRLWWALSKTRTWRQRGSP